MSDRDPDRNERGVYVIWRLPKTGVIEYLDVGSGELSGRLVDHYKQHPEWEDANYFSATVDPDDLLGVEAFLADQLRRRGQSGRNYPDVRRIWISDPFGIEWH